METFTLVMFWWMVVTVFVRLCIIQVESFPWVQMTSLNQMVAKVLILLPFIMWSGMLLWW